MQRTKNSKVSGGYGNPVTITLRESEAEKDLGVIVDNDLSFKEHIGKSVKQASNTVGAIRRSFEHLDNELFLQLYKSLVRPKLEYGHLLWNPHLKYLQEAIANVQRDATRMVPGLGDLTYSERLRTLKLPSLQHRRLRGDMIETYKYMQGMYSVDKPKFVKNEREFYETRGHSYALRKNQLRNGKQHSYRNNFLTERVF